MEMTLTIPPRPLSWITKIAKGDFNGRDKILAVKENGPTRKLVGFEMIDRGIPRSHYEIAFDRKIVGHVTSGSLSPIRNIGIGMGYVPSHLAIPGTEIDIMIRDKAVKAKIVKPPFIEK